MAWQPGQPLPNYPPPNGNRVMPPPTNGAGPVVGICSAGMLTAGPGGSASSVFLVGPQLAQHIGDNPIFDFTPTWNGLPVSGDYTKRPFAEQGAWSACGLLTGNPHVFPDLSIKAILVGIIILPLYYTYPPYPGYPDGQTVSMGLATGVRIVELQDGNYSIPFAAKAVNASPVVWPAHIFFSMQSSTYPPSVLVVDAPVTPNFNTAFRGQVLFPYASAADEFGQIQVTMLDGTLLDWPSISGPSTIPPGILSPAVLAQSGMPSYIGTVSGPSNENPTIIDPTYSTLNPIFTPGLPATPNAAYLALRVTMQPAGYSLYLTGLNIQLQ